MAAEDAGGDEADAELAGVNVAVAAGLPDPPQPVSVSAATARMAAGTAASGNVRGCSTMAVPRLVVREERSISVAVIVDTDATVYKRKNRDASRGPAAAPLAATFWP